MAIGGPTNDSGLKTQLHELVKQHLVYDGSGRCTDIYTALFNAANGVPCTHVQYQYSAVVGQTTLVTGMKEFNDTWNSAWDF